MSLRIDPKLKSPPPMAPAPSNVKKPEVRKEISRPTYNGKSTVQNLDKNNPVNSLKESSKKSSEVNEVDDDMLFSAELENQIEKEELVSLEGMEEIPVTQKEAATALSALAGLAAAQEQMAAKAPVEVVFNDAPISNPVNNQELPVNVKQVNSDLQALLAGDGNLNVTLPQVDPAMTDKMVISADAEMVDPEGKIKLAKSLDEKIINDGNAKLVDSDNVIDLINQKRNVKGPAQQYANQNPKLILEKVMKEVKAKSGNMEISPDEVKMMKNLDYLADADKAVKFLGGEKENQASLDTKNTKSADKVFDLSKIKTSNATEIINQISDYIIQSKTAKATNVDLAVNHSELGRININVTKLNPEQVNIQIMAQTPEGKQFFAENSRGLLNHLSTNGVNVADLKLDSTSSSNLNSGKDNSSSEQQFTGGRGQHAHNQSEDNNRRQDSKRREDLWDLYRRNAA